MTTIDQKLRDKFKAALIRSVYRNATDGLIDVLFKWDRSQQVYTNVAVQSLFVLFLSGVEHGKDTSDKTDDQPDPTE